MAHACGRKDGAAPIQQLFGLDLEKDELAFIYLGFAGILLRSRDRTLAFDLGGECLRPAEIAALETLDVQFYSHTHWDHWDAETTIRILQRTGAPIVAEPSVVQEMEGTVHPAMLRTAIPGQPLTIDDLEISGIRGVHPRPIIMFQVQWADLRIFHGADSGPVPLADYPADVAFVPTGSPSPSCSPENALKMILDVKPQVAVAMHGTQPQLRKFRRLVARELPGTAVLTPDPCELVRVRVGGA